MSVCHHIMRRFLGKGEPMYAEDERYECTACGAGAKVWEGRLAWEWKDRPKHPPRPMPVPDEPDVSDESIDAAKSALALGTSQLLVGLTELVIQVRDQNTATQNALQGIHNDLRDRINKLTTGRQ